MIVCPECDGRLKDNFSCRTCGFVAGNIDGFPAFSPQFAMANSNYVAAFHEKLFHLEQNCFWFSERNNLLNWALKKYYPSAATFLEIGCGTGYVLHGLSLACPQIQCTGADIYTSGLKFASKRLPKTRFIQMDARHFPYRDEFDVIGAFDIIEHVEEDQQILQQMYNAVRPGGGIIITVPQHKWLWSETDVYGCHKRRYTRHELNEKIVKSGFEVIKIVSFMSLLLPLLILFRARYALFSKEMIKKSIDKELSIRRPLNGLLRLICMVETRLIQSNFSFPAGGSLLCIAKKRRMYDHQSPQHSL